MDAELLSGRGTGDTQSDPHLLHTEKRGKTKNGLVAGIEVVRMFAWLPEEGAAVCHAASRSRHLNGRLERLAGLRISQGQVGAEKATALGFEDLRPSL